jgi:hypothetical protein
MTGPDATAELVRHVLPHERMDDLVDEAKSLTYEHFREFAVVETQGGARALLRGGRYEIELQRSVGNDPFGRPPGRIFFLHDDEEVYVTRLVFHTHPKPTGPSDGDCDVLRLLGQKDSMLYELSATLKVRASAPRVREVEMQESLASVKDAFEIKAGTAGSNHEAGLVIIFDGRQCGFNLPPRGSRVSLLRPDGASREAVVEEMKEHGDGRSFFFRALTKADAPIGTIVSWTAAGEIHPARAVAVAAG